MSLSYPQWRCILVGVLMVAAVPACREEAPAPTEAQEPSPARRADDLLDFPVALRSDDPAVNDFVERAMRICAAGDYEAFRLLWTARQEPLSRGEFDQGWQAVQTIRLRALQKGVLAGGLEAHDEGATTAGDEVPDGGTETREVVYALLARVTLDPDHPAGRAEPEREVVLMMIREQDAWRLARAPRAMRAWIREQVETAAEEAKDEAPPVHPSTQP